MGPVGFSSCDQALAGRMGRPSLWLREMIGGHLGLVRFGSPEPGRTRVRPGPGRTIEASIAALSLLLGGHCSLEACLDFGLQDLTPS